MNIAIRRKDNSHDKKQLHQRRGVILLIVLVVVVALSVVAYGFSRQMVIELSTTQAITQNVQQELLVDSVVEQLLASDPIEVAKLCVPVDERSVSPKRIKNLSDRDQPSLAKLKLPGRNEEGVAIMAITATPPDSSTLQFGLRNESSKLNLNSLVGKRLSRQQVIAKLMKYKDLSESTAAGIANLLGVFDSQSSSGNPPRPASENPMERFVVRSMRQLLTVPGVTEERLLGEDRNGNGVLDPNENDGDGSWPADNADGKLDAGWSAHWTLIGSESNFQQDGKPKIDLNQTDLVALYDQLLDFATPEEARFVVAWRVSSPVYTDSSERNKEDVKKEIENELNKTFDDRLANQLGNNPVAPVGKPEQTGPKLRAGINLDITTAREVKSLLEFSSCQLQLLIEGKDTILVSPFANDAASLARWLPMWEARTRITSGSVNNTRINILQASLPTLTTVEGVSEELAKAIIAQRTSIDNSRLISDSQDKQITIGWLLEAGLVTTAELRLISDEITVGGSVLQGYAVGQLERTRTAAIRFIELDGRGTRMKLRRSIDLAPLSANERL